MGKEGTMPWGAKPLDGTHFRRLTEGHTVVMGRKTFESMGRRGLKNRVNIVLTNNLEYHVPPSTVNVILSDVDEVIEVSKSFSDKDFWIIGGSQVFEVFMPYIEEMWVTTIGETFEGDTYFPNELMHSYKWHHSLMDTDNVNGYLLTFRRFRKA